MHFTVDENPEIDSQVLEDIRRIEAAVKNSVAKDNYIALFLVGGFGRGEGGVIFMDGRFKPSNDYDFELITSNPLKDGMLEELGKSLASELGISWVHIESHTDSSLSRMKFTMYNYDLKYGSHFISGDKNILDSIPDMNPSEMPWREAENLLFTRLWGFIGAFKIDMLKRDLSEEEKRFLSGQLSKSLLAIQDTYLILNRLYHHSYKQRLKNLEKISVPDELRPICEWAACFKLTPEKSEIPDLPDFFFLVKKYYCESLLFLYSSVYKRKFNSWKEFEKIHFYSFYTLLKRFYFFTVKRSRWYIDFLNYNMAVIYLVKALDKEDISKDFLERADYFFRKIDSYNPPADLNWPLLQDEALNLRERIWH
jgi:hypothetical protein